jgi:hypothetical protein
MLKVEERKIRNVLEEIVLSSPTNRLRHKYFFAKAIVE